LIFYLKRKTWDSSLRSEWQYGFLQAVSVFLNSTTFKHFYKI
jgi:hypothetical protein